MKNILFACVLVLGLVLNSCTVKDKENLNDEASITELEELPENPLLLIPMTTSINRKENKTSTLYGNSVAVKYATEYTDGNYPVGSLLYKVTWQTEPDAFWFGANIPNQIKLVERVEFDKNNYPLYDMYLGKSLKKVRMNQEENSFKIKSIVTEKMAVSP